MVKNEQVAIIIRPMAHGDIQAVFAIEVDTFTDSWPREAFAQWLGEDWAVNLVALDEDRIVGYLCAVGQEDELHVHNIAVTRNYRGRGVGRLLLAQAESWGRKSQKLCAILDVRESNVNAISFYQTSGYEMIGRRKEYYDHPPENALVFMKILCDGLTKPD